MSWLGDDMTVEILKQLPLKSRVQFQVVCRQWHSLINIYTRKPFMTIYLAHLKEAYLGYKTEKDSISLSTLTDLGFPYTNIVSCNGLYLGVNDHDYVCCICNPWNKEYFLLPYPPKSTTPSYMIPGFAFDPDIAGDFASYKVVLAFLIDYCRSRDQKSLYQMQIYSSESSTWKEKWVKAPPNRYITGKSVFWNHRLHWLWGTNGILSWDMSSKNSTTLELNLSNVSEYDARQLAVEGDHMYYIRISSTSAMLNIWKMTPTNSIKGEGQCGLIKHTTVNLHMDINNSFIYPLGILCGGNKVVVVADECDEIRSFDIKTRNFESICQTNHRSLWELNYSPFTRTMKLLTKERLRHE